MLMWTPKMWHMRAQRRHAKFSTSSPQPLKSIYQEAEPLTLDHIKHKRHFSNTTAGKSNGLRAYFGYE